MVSYSGSSFSKNEKLIELLGYVRKIMDEPTNILKSKLSKKAEVREGYLKNCIQLVRMYHGFDLNQA